MAVNRAKYYTGIKAIPELSRFRISMMKYLLQKKKYPLFRVSRKSGGILMTNILQKQMGMCKFTGFNGHYYFSLTVPRWPSPAFDNMVANGGLNIAAAGTALKKQIDTVIIGITRKCIYKCSHCYEYFNLGEDDVISSARWIQVIKDIQKSGVSIITLSGGEPMMRFKEVIKILKASDHTLSDFHIHTSGYGVTAEKCRELKNSGLIAAGIGLDDHDPQRHDKFRGFSGAFENAINAIKLFREAGVFTYINFCPSRTLLNPDNFRKYLELVKELNVGFIRWLEPKPCGKYSDAGPGVLLDQDDSKILLKKYSELNSGLLHRDHPPVSYEAFSESPENMGCMMGGNSLLYIDTLGNVEPCVFLPVSFGNILDEEFPVILQKIRKVIHSPVYKGCPSFIMAGSLREAGSGNFGHPVPYELLKKEFDDLYC